MILGNNNIYMKMLQYYLLLQLNEELTNLVY